jgi:hypothetical protein
MRATKRTCTWLILAGSLAVTGCASDEKLREEHFASLVGGYGNTTAEQPFSMFIDLGGSMGRVRQEEMGHVATQDVLVSAGIQFKWGFAPR